MLTLFMHIMITFFTTKNVFLTSLMTQLEPSFQKSQYATWCYSSKTVQLCPPFWIYFNSFGHKKILWIQELCQSLMHWGKFLISKYLSIYRRT